MAAGGGAVLARPRGDHRRTGSGNASSTGRASLPDRRWRHRLDRLRRTGRPLRPTPQLCPGPSRHRPHRPGRGWCRPPGRDEVTGVRLPDRRDPRCRPVRQRVAGQGLLVVLVGRTRQRRMVSEHHGGRWPGTAARNGGGVVVLEGHDVVDHPTAEHRSTAGPSRCTSSRHPGQPLQLQASPVRALEAAHHHSPRHGSSTDGGAGRR